MAVSLPLLLLLLLSGCANIMATPVGAVVVATLVELPGSTTASTTMALSCQFIDFNLFRTPPALLERKCDYMISPSHTCVRETVGLPRFRRFLLSGHFVLPLVAYWKVSSGLAFLAHLLCIAQMLGSMVWNPLASWVLGCLGLPPTPQPSLFLAHLSCHSRFISWDSVLMSCVLHELICS